MADNAAISAEVKSETQHFQWRVLLITFIILAIVGVVYLIGKGIAGIFHGTTPSQTTTQQAAPDTVASGDNIESNAAPVAIKPNATAPAASVVSNWNVIAVNPSPTPSPTPTGTVANSTGGNTTASSGTHVCADYKTWDGKPLQCDSQERIVSDLTKVD